MKIGALRAAAICGALVCCASVTGAQAATVTYTDAAVFQGAIGSSITDTYQSGYEHGDVHDGPLSNPDTFSDAAMSAVKGQTTYTSTGFTDNNTVFHFGSGSYCAGCNGSFVLGFATTSLSASGGVYGVGFNFFNFRDLPYTGFVTFGDASTQNYLFPVDYNNGSPTAFFGITSDLAISSIAFGLVNGGTTTEGSFGIANLIIAGAADATAAVPGPIVGAGLPGIVFAGGGLLAWWRRKRKQAGEGVHDNKK